MIENIAVIAAISVLTAVYAIPVILRARRLRLASFANFISWEIICLRRFFHRVFLFWTVKLLGKIA